MTSLSRVHCIYSVDRSHDKVLERFICDFSCRYAWAQNKKWSFHVCWKDYDGIDWNNSFGWLVSVLFQLYSAALRVTWIPFVLLLHYRLFPTLSESLVLCHYIITSQSPCYSQECSAVQCGNTDSTGVYMDCTLLNRWKVSRCSTY
jgi:hypothetical protein